ncbi:MAG: sulfatase/phosphatase domain-containing protein, partial [Steroidobacteraceae bacterium]
ALSFPIAGDVASSPSWQAIERQPSLGLGARPLAAFLHRPREELYDLAQDPNELKNLAADAKYRDVLERMREEMEKFRAETRDPWLPGQIAVHGHEAH